MIVVLCFLAFLILISFYIFLFMISNLKIDIQNLVIEGGTKIEVKKEYKIKLGIYFLNRIKIFGYTFTSAKLERLKLTKKLHFKKFGNINYIYNDPIKNLKITIEKLNLNAFIGTEDLLLTTGIIFGISVLIACGLPFIISHKYEKNIYYKILPVYRDKNYLNFKLNCIISVKMVHIINIIYTYLQKRRVDKYGGTSNRRAYEGSYD